MKLGSSFRAAIVLSCVLGWTSPSNAGSIFVSGHDSDFHAALGGNAVGAQNIIRAALTFARDGNALPILFLQSGLDNVSLGDHTDSEQGLIASGFAAGNTPGDNYVKVNATQFATEDLSLYSAILLPSDHGGTLTGDDLQAVNARTTDLIAYLNGGGGLVAFAQDGDRTPATVGPQPTNFGFLPFLVSAAPLGAFESGNTVTPFGAGFGLTDADINGNFSHNVFLATGGMSIVDVSPTGEILSLAFRGQIGPTGVIPEPATWMLLGTGLCALRRRRR